VRDLWVRGKAEVVSVLCLLSVVFVRFLFCSSFPSQQITYRRSDHILKTS
jgi:hypothetical protein